MNELLNQVTQMGITLDSNSAVEIAKYWFYTQIMRFSSLTIVFGSLFTFAFICIRKSMIHEGTWNNEK